MSVYIRSRKQVNVNQILFDRETEKVVLEVETLQKGMINEINISNGEYVSSEQAVIRWRLAIHWTTLNSL